MIVNFFEASANFELPPEQAIEYFAGKGLKQSYNWYEMINQDHDLSFTVAKMMDDDLLITVRKELDKAIATGSTLADFKKNLIPILQKKGWWGKKDIIDAATGYVTKIQLGSASRLENIFRTNMQSSYAAGQWQEIQETKESIPYLMYDAVDDERTRKEHAQFDGLVLPVDDPLWESHYPPNGWGCRCGVIQMDEEDLEGEQLKISKTPKLKKYDWTNPTTGQIMKIPEGVDPGFNHNAGISQKTKLDALQIEKHAKIAKIDAAAAEQAKKGAIATKAKAEKLKSDKTPILSLEEENKEWYQRNSLVIINGTKLQFDKIKSQKNAVERGIPFSMVAEMEWQDAIIKQDIRKVYDEERFIAHGIIGDRLYVVGFTIVDDGFRVFTMRKANKREVKKYVEQQN